MAIVNLMWQRGLICLAIILSFCVSVVAFVPAGGGPYTAVYGPASALRAQRSILLLVLAIGFVSTVFALLAAPGSSTSELPAAVRGPAQPFPASDLSSSLRC